MARIAGAGVLAGPFKTALPAFNVLWLVAGPAFRLHRRMAAAAPRRVHRPSLGKVLAVLGPLLICHGRVYRRTQAEAASLRPHKDFLSALQIECRRPCRDS